MHDFRIIWCHGSFTVIKSDVDVSVGRRQIMTHCLTSWAPQKCLESPRSLRTRLWEPLCRELNTLHVSLLDQWSHLSWHQGLVSWGKKKRQFSQGLGCGVIQASHTYCALHFCYHYTSFSSDCQAPALGIWALLQLHDAPVWHWKATWPSFCPFPQFRWLSLTLHVARLCSVYVLCVRLHEQGSKVGFPWQALWLKGLKGTTLAFSIYKHFPGHSHLHATEPTLQKMETIIPLAAFRHITVRLINRNKWLANSSPRLQIQY